jgi:hypothetical protein
VAPTIVLILPYEQLEQIVLALKAEKDPIPQLRQVVDAAAEYFPERQSKQTDASISLVNLPLGHREQLTRPNPFAKVPGSHMLHVVCPGLS